MTNINDIWEFWAIDAWGLDIWGVSGPAVPFNPAWAANCNSTIGFTDVYP